MSKFPAILMLLTATASAGPTVEITGGRYNVSGLNGYYLTAHTAEAAAVNEAFRCKCVVTISQPDIKVRAVYASAGALLSWDRPTHRENGDPLALEEIAGFEITITSESGSNVVKVGNILSYKFDELDAGTYTFSIKTIDTNGLASAESKQALKTI